MNIYETAAQLEALGSPTRLRIFRTLVMAGGPGLSVGSLQDEIGIAASTLSHHLQKLIIVGLAMQERRSTTLICRANFGMMRALVDNLVDSCCANAPASSEAAQVPLSSP